MKYYLFSSASNIPFETLQHVFVEAYQNQFTMELLSAKTGYIHAENDFLETIEMLLPIINNDLGISLVFLVSHSLKHPLVKEAFSRVTRLRQGVYHLADMTLEAMMKVDHGFLSLMQHAFDEVPHDWMLTAEMLIRCGLNRSLAARKLYVHRNTFNYRLNKFIELTGLDIRDYFNAQFFYLYTQLNH